MMRGPLKIPMDSDPPDRLGRQRRDVVAQCLPDRDAVSRPVTVKFPDPVFLKFCLIKTNMKVTITNDHHLMASFRAHLSDASESLRERLRTLISTSR